MDFQTFPFECMNFKNLNQSQYYQQMGLFQSHAQQTPQWSQGFSIIADKLGNQYQLFRFILNPIYDLEQEMQIYQQRKKINSPIIKIYHAQYRQLAKSYFNSNYQIRVITEKITHKLSEAPQLTYSQSIYILLQTLKGFQIIYQRVGPINPTSNMILFNNQGICKVWLNENYSKNYPQSYKKGLQSTISQKPLLFGRPSQSNSVNVEEAIFVSKIIDIVEDKCQEGRFPDNLRNQLKNVYLSFKQAQQIIGLMIKVDSIYIPKMVDLKYNLIPKQVIISRYNSYQEKLTLVNRYSNSHQPKIFEESEVIEHTLKHKSFDQKHNQYQVQDISLNKELNIIFKEKQYTLRQN